MYSIKYEEKEKTVYILHDGEVVTSCPQFTNMSDVLLGMLNAQELAFKNLNLDINISPKKPILEEEEPINEPEPEEEEKPFNELDIKKQMEDLSYVEPFNGAGDPPYYVYAEASNDKGEKIARYSYWIEDYKDFTLLVDKLYEICKNKCDFDIFQQLLYQGYHSFANYKHNAVVVKNISDVKDFYINIDEEQNDKDIEVDDE